MSDNQEPEDGPKIIVPPEAGAQDTEQPVVGTEPLDEHEARRINLPETIPVLPAKNFTIFPHVVLPTAAEGERDTKLVNEAVLKDRLIVYTAVKNPEAEEPQPEDLYRVGCATGVLKMLRFPDDTLRLLVQGLSRVRITKFVQTDPYLVAQIERLEEEPYDKKEIEPLKRTLVGQFQKMVDMSPQLPDDLKIAALNIEDDSRLCDLIASATSIDMGKRQKLLETLNVPLRMRQVLSYVNEEMQMLEVSSKIQESVKSDMEKGQREFMLRRQLKAIQDELGETDPHEAEIAELRKQVEEAKLPEEARKEAERELERLERMPPQASEYTVARTYLDWVLALPWHKKTRDHLKIDRAEKILDEDHYGLEKVKKRILEYIAVRKLKKDMRGPILCFVGPPGTGKTSLGRSIARTLGRKFARISLGGVRDEAEIRGHRRTYVGAMPGRIIQGLRKADANNPVFMLDEVDKLGADFRGDPSAALLEVLDPEQNFSFSDHYLDVPFDLSKVMFITTANVLATIPEPLRDRMEVIELPGYTEEEKIKIAQQYLVPRQLKHHGLKETDLQIPDDVLKRIISDYTREAGLRNLEREIGSLCRKVATEKAREGKEFKARKLKAEDLAEMLGPRRFFREVAERTSDPGVATGLAWTPHGGEVLFIEATAMRGRGQLQLTGQLGDVMKESAQAALSYVKSRAKDFGLAPDMFGKTDIHMHVPTGAIPKDGPSAGVTMAMALISLLTRKSVRPDVAMTGEVTLRGRVLPVGGIRDKCLAARRAEIKKVILPEHNEKDLTDIPEELRKDLEFVFVDHIDGMLPHVFADGDPRLAKTTRKKQAKKKAKKKTAKASA